MKIKEAQAELQAVLAITERHTSLRLKGSGEILKVLRTVSSARQWLERELKEA